MNFADVGIRWTVRQSSGERLRFSDLAALQEALDAGEITADDELTFDGNIWRKIKEIPDLRAYFWQVWMRAQRGEILANWMPIIGATEGGVEEDAPTTIALPDGELSEAIQAVLSRELMARSRARLSPAPSEPAEHAEPATAPHVAAHSPPPSELPRIWRAMGLSLVLTVVALGVMLSIP